MQTAHATIAEVNEEKQSPRYDLIKWRADVAELTEKIRENKQVLRTGYKGSHELSVSNPEWKIASALLVKQGLAQSNARHLARRATELYIFRAALRGREHIPGFNSEQRAGIVEKLSGEYLKK